MSGEDAVWVPYDHEHRDANPLPEGPDLVWVHDSFYEGVTLGYYARTPGGPGWWNNVYGSDDIGVTHWMRLDRPAPPEQFGRTSASGGDS